jgi:uncharacterized membrane protein YjfL (UPF0719 family)
MNELFDKLLLRGVFTAFVCSFLYLYKYAHSFLYPSAKQQIFKKFFPSQNPPYSLHFFSRIIGLGIVLSTLHFNLNNGIIIAMGDFFVIGVASIFLFLLSIYIMEGIILFNFDYTDEVLKRKNLSYSILSFSLALSLAIILKSIVREAGSSFITLLFMWMFSIVIFGFAVKGYKYVSNLNFNRLMIQKNISIALSFAGFCFGFSLIISSSFHQKADGIQNYSILVLLRILLSGIIFPIFKKGILLAFNLKDDFDHEDNSKEANWGYGLFEGSLFLTSCYLTSIITGQIEFGNFYPIF